MGWLSKKWKQIKGWFTPSKPKPAGVNIEKSGTNQGVPIIYGYIAKAPSIKIFKVTTDKSGGAKNEYLHFICVFCVGEIEEIGDIYFNDVCETEIDDERYHIERFNGSEVQSHCETLSSEFSAWKSTARLKSVAYAYVRLKQNKSINWWRSEPTVKANIKGLKVLDLRTNEKIYSTNNALCTYDYLTNPWYGKALVTSKINSASVIASANLVELEREYTQTVAITKWVDYDNDRLPELYEFVTTQETQTITENLISCNVSLDTEKTIKKNVEILLGGMRAILPETDGKYRISIEKDNEPVFAFTQDNISKAIQCKGGEQSDRYNQVIIKFRNVLTGGDDEAVFPADDNLHQEWLTQDNGKLLLGEFEFDTINNKAEALQMGHIIAHRSRNLIGALFSGLPETIVVEAGDIVTVDSKIFGWNAKPFRIESADIDLETGQMDFQAVEHQNTIYPWAVDDVNEEYVDTSFLLPSSIRTPTGLAFESMPTSNAYQCKFTWDDPNNVIVSSHRLRIYLIANDSLVFSSSTEQNSINVPLLGVGEYRAELVAQNKLFNSDTTLLLFTVEVPIAPSELTLTASNFEVIATPVLQVRNHFTEFELRMNTIDDFETSSIVGLAKIFQVTSLLPDTMHYFWCRTVTPFGNSAYINNSIITTNNPDEMLEFLGIDVEALGVIQEKTEDILGELPEIYSVIDGVIEDTDLVAQEAQSNRLAINEIKNKITIESFAMAEKDWQYVQSLLDKELAISDLVEHNLNFAVSQQSFVTDVTELKSTAEIHTTAIAAHGEAFGVVADDILALSTADTALTNRTSTLEAKVDLEDGETVTAIAQKISRAQVSYCTISRDSEGNPVENKASCEELGGTWVTDKPISELLHGVNVTNSAGENISAVSYLQALEDENGQLKARAFFGLDSDGKKGMLVYNDTTGEYDRFVMNMITDDFVLSKTDGTPSLYHDTESDELTVIGRIGATELVLSDGTVINNAEDIAGQKGDDGILPAPSGNPGLFASATHLGYHSGESWKTYIDNEGKFYFVGADGNFLKWDGNKLTSNKLEITSQGIITAEGAQLKGITIYDEEDNVILSSNGFEGTYIQSLIAEALDVTTIRAENVEGAFFGKLIKPTQLEAPIVLDSNWVDVGVSISFDAESFDRVLEISPGVKVSIDHDDDDNYPTFQSRFILNGVVVPSGLFHVAKNTEGTYRVQMRSDTSRYMFSSVTIIGTDTTATIYKETNALY